MTSAALIEALIDLGFPEDAQFAVPDTDYALPLESSLPDFARAWSETRFELGLNYSPEAEDCDDFSRLCACFAELRHARSPGRPRNTALAFGVVWYEREDGGGHALNFFLTNRGGALALGFFEPQTSQPVTLSPAEIESILEVQL